MKPRNNHFFSIRTKLTLFVFLTMAIITSLGLSFIIHRDIDLLHTELLNETHAYVKFLNQDFIKILDTGSIDIAADLTNRLRNISTIKGIILYNTENVAIYEYRRPGIDQLLPASAGLEHHHKFINDALTLVHGVDYAGVSFGNSYMQVSTASLSNERHSIIEQALIISIAAIASSLLLITLLQRYFSQPIMQLVSVLRRTGDSQDHSLQLEVTQKDEIGELFAGFNSMQEKIQQANHKLKLDNERRDMALSVANDGIWDWDIVSDSITFDNRFYTLAGYQPGDYPHAFEEWEKRVYPNHLESVTADIERYLKGEIATFDVEFRFLRKDGTYMWIRCRGKITSRDAQGKPLRFVGTHSDISEQKKIESALRDSEYVYRMLFEKSADAILIIEDEKFIDCNSATVALLGYKDKKELLKTHPSELSPELQPDGRDSFDKANEMMSIAIRDSSNRFEWDHKRLDGSIIPVEVLLTSIPVAGRNLIHVVWRDISDRKQTEAALRRSQKMDAIGQLTGGIAHDFNNILGIILGNLSLLERHIDTDEKTGKRIDTIKYTAQRAVNLTKQLLNFSRNEASTIEVSDINRSIKKMHTLITQSLTPQIEVNYRLAENLWQTEIDSGDFEDALLNLILNARDAMSDKGKLVIETCNTRLDDEFCSRNPGTQVGDYVELVVSDNGDGIAREFQEKIFDPFYTTKEPGKGTGLGLAMVFGFIKRSSGTIEVHSELGIGTTFSLYLPRAATDGLPVESVSSQTDEMPEGAEAILIVDDEVALLELVEDTLQALGYTIFTASNGDQALEILAQHADIKLMFSDVVMPGMNGYELADRALAIYPHLKVLLTSGYTGMAIAHNGQARYNEHILSKPYSQADLAQRVRAMLDGECNNEAV